MKAILTKYLAPTSRRTAKVCATDGDGNSVKVDWDGAYDREPNHTQAALALCRKMGWTGELIGGETKDGYAFVWDDRTRSNRTTRITI